MLESVLLMVILLVAVFGAVRFVQGRWREVVVLSHQRGLSYRRGVLEGLLEPGVYWSSARRQIVLVEVRTQMLQLPGQEILTTDGIAVKLSASVEYAIVDPLLMAASSANFQGMLYAQAQQSLREAVGELAFEAVLAGRVAIGNRMQGLLSGRAVVMGALVSSAVVLDVMLPADIRRAYAEALTAQKQGLAALERARGETASLRSLANAARLMQEHPGLLELRALQALEGSKGSPVLELRVGGTG